MNKLLMIGAMCVALIPGLVLAQVEPESGPVYVSEPAIPSISPAVRDLPTPIPGKDVYGQEMKRREDYGFIAPYYEGPQRMDPLVDLQSLSGPPSTDAFGTPTHNFDGMTSPSSPPDDTGDVGLNHFLQGINGDGTFSTSCVRVVNKTTGANMKTFSLQSLATASPCNSGYCDPIVLYDRVADRWIVTEFPSSGGHLCVYVSTTADPTGTWYAYTFMNVESSTPDYPKYGVWPQNGNAGGSYLIGINAGATGVHDLVALDRGKMLAGQPATYQKFSVPNEPNFGFQLVLPAHMQGKNAPPNGDPAIFMRPRDDEAQDGASTPAYDLMEMWALQVDWATPANSTLTQLASLHIGDYDCSMCGLSGTWNCMPQAGTSQKIDPIREPLHFPLQYRNFGDHQTLVGCFVEDVDGTDHAALRWFDIRKPTGGSWSLNQEGVVGGEANVHRSVGSAAMDGSHNIAIGYTRTGTSLYPSIYYKGRLSTDAAGTMPQGEYVIRDATTSKTGNERWGDYAGIGVDPADDCTFWFTTEYGGSGQTKIASFKFDACGFAGSVALDKSLYACSGAINITVSDASLIGATTQNVEIWSTTESTHEVVTLAATPAGSATFTGTLSIVTTAPVNGDGKLSVANGDAITVLYIDADDGAGGTNVPRNASGTVDCTGPVISNVQVTNITDSGATVTWTTNENANSRVTYGTVSPPGTNKDDLANYVTSHSVTLTGLTGCTKYYFSVTSADVAGNSASDSNGGTYFSFTTAGRAFAMGPDTVEGGVLSWVATGTAGALWHQDTCKAASGTHSWKAGASDAPTCTAQYVISADSYLTWSANITLGSTGHGYHLRWNEWYDTESGYDWLTPQISTDGGGTWSNLVTHYAGSSGGWLAKDVDLAAYTGSTVRIRFWFHSDSSQNGLGWYVDDIEISKTQSCTADVSYQSNTFADACSSGGAGNANGVIDSGEDITVHPVLKNTGSQGATGLSATLSTSTPGITVTSATVTYPDLASGASAACDAPHFAFSVGTGVACGTTINFSLHITAAGGGGPWDRTFTMTVGNVVAGGTITDFSQNFDSVTPPALPAGWTVSHTSGNDWVTASGGCTGNGLRYPYNSTQAANSWAYTPGIALTAGVTYTLAFNQKIQSTTWPETMEVKAGTAATPAGQTITVLASATYSNTTCTLRSPTFTVPATGTYYLGFHCTSVADTYYLWVDDVALTHTSTPSCTMTACTPVVTPPGEAAPGDTPATAQSWTNKTTQTWPAVTGATGYTLYRGILADLPQLLNSSTDSCTKTSGSATSATVNDDPAGVSGRFYWYLVTASNGAGEGTPGSATAGTRVVNSSGTCP